MKVVHRIGHWGADSPDGQPLMVAYWSAFLECAYANAAYLDWFGKPVSTDITTLNLAELLGDSLPAFEPYLMDVLNGSASNCELGWRSRSGSEEKRALFRLVPDFSGEEVRGFMLTGIDLPTMGAYAKGRRKAVDGQLPDFRQPPADDSLGAKLQRYSDELKDLLSEYWSSPTVNAERRLTSVFSRDEESEISVRDAGSEAFTTEVNLYDCISRAVSSIEEELRDKGCSVRIRVSPFIYVHANPKYMESIIRHFIGSALIHRSTDRVPVIELSSMVVGDETILNIKDNGKGLNLDFFYGRAAGNAGQSEDHESGDVRRRLFTVRQQVYAMGGYIGVESEPETGTWFRVYFKTKLDQFSH